MAYLVLERGRPIPRTELADVLWADELPRTWESALRGVVTKVRRVLADAVGDGGSAAVSSRNGAYVVEGDLVVDVEQARRDVEDARTEANDGRLEEALCRVERALPITAAPLLPGVTNGWVDDQQLTMDACHRRALALAAEVALDLGRPDDALRHALSLLDADRLDEAGHRARIRAHFDRGEPVEAERAYVELVRILDEDLGVPPSEQTDDLLAAGRAAAASAHLATRPPPPLPSATAFGGFTPFVGRARDLEIVRTRLQTDGVAIVEGDAGVGKSRLVWELAREHRDRDTWVLGGGCTESAAAPYEPFAEALGVLGAACGPDGLRRLVSPNLAPHLVRVVPALAADLGPAPDGSPALDPPAAHRAVSETLTALAAEVSVLIVLEDVHWAQDSTCALLRQLIRAGTGARILITTRSRSDSPSWNSLLDELGRGAMQPIELGGMERLDVAVLFEAVTGEPSSDEIRDAIHAATAGNAFLIQEVLREIVESGRGASRSGLDLIRSAGLEGSVGAVARRRARSIGPGAMRTLATAATMGQEFDFVVLDQVDREGATASTVDAAVRAGLLTPVDGRAGRLRFVHDLVREAIAEGIGPIEASRAHDRIADALADVWATDLGPHLPALAHHARRSLLEGGDSTRAVDYSMRAAKQAASAYAYDDAIEQVDRGLSALELGAPRAEDERPELLLTLGRAQVGAGRVEQGRDTLREAHGCALTRGAAVTAAEAAITFSEAGVRSGTAGADPDMLRASLTLLEGSSAAELIARATARLAFDSPGDDRAMTTARQQLGRDAVRLARRAGDPDALVDALLCLRLTLVGAPPDTARGLTEEALAIAEAHDRITPEVLLHRAFDLTDQGRFDDARTLLEHGEQLAIEVGRPAVGWTRELWLGAFELLCGRIGRAERHADAAIDRAGEAFGHEAFRRVVGQFFAIRRTQGRLGELEDLLTPARAQVPGARTWQAASALAAVTRGDLALARGIVDEIMARPVPTWPENETLPATLAMLADVLGQLGDPRHAPGIADGLRPFAGLWLTTDRFCAVMMGRTERYLGLTLALLDDPTGEVLLREALAAHRAVGADLFTAYTLIDLAMVGSRSDETARRQEAKSMAAEAEAIGSRLGLADVVERVARLA